LTCNAALAPAANRGTPTTVAVLVAGNRLSQLQPPFLLVAVLVAVAIVIVSSVFSQSSSKYGRSTFARQYVLYPSNLTKLPFA
jgi:hypothetical protein